MAICLTKPNLNMCKVINQMIEYSFSIAFNPMRNKQDGTSQKLHDELEKLAIEDETLQYAIMGICIGLVVTGSIVIIPIFIWVIKDKSYVFTIFSNIEDDEIHTIIANCKKMDLKNLRYKRKWLANSEGNQEAFWKKMIIENSRKDKNTLKKFANESLANYFENVSKKKEEKSEAGPKLVIQGLIPKAVENAVENAAENAAEKAAESNAEEAQEGEAGPAINAQSSKVKLDADMRRTKRNEMLSEIE